MNRDDDELFGNAHHYKPPHNFLDDALGGPKYRNDKMGSPNIKGGRREKRRELLRFDYLAEPGQAVPQGEVRRRRLFKGLLARRLGAMSKDEADLYPSFESYAKLTYLLDANGLPYMTLGRGAVRDLLLPWDGPARFFIRTAIETVRELGLASQRYPKPEFLRSVFFDIVKSNNVCLRLELSYYFYLRKILEEGSELRGKFPRPEDLGAPKAEDGDATARPKLQTSIRTDAGLLALVDQLTDNRSAWIVDAISEKLERDGHSISDKALSAAFDRAQTKSSAKHPKRQQNPNRVQAALPNPNKPADSSVNRLREQVPLRLEPNLLEQIDGVRKSANQSRVAWMEAAMTEALSGQLVISEDYHPTERATKAIGLRLAPTMVEEIDVAAEAANLSRSDWIRRVCVARLNKRQFDYNKEIGRDPS